MCSLQCSSVQECAGVWTAVLFCISVQCAAWQCGPAPLATRSPAASKNVAATLLGEKALESGIQDPSLTAPPHTEGHTNILADFARRQGGH